MFSVLPLVFLVSTSSDVSVSLMTAAALSPKNGKPPPGVAVASVTLSLGSCHYAAASRLLEIGDDVVLVLEADRQPHHVRAGAGLHLLRVGQSGGAWSRPDG